MHADRHFNAHVCAASSIRAMPEDEKPPASRVDIFFGGGEGNWTPVRKPSWQTFYRLSGWYEFPSRRTSSAGCRSVVLKGFTDAQDRTSVSSPSELTLHKPRRWEIVTGMSLLIKQQRVRNYCLRLCLIPTFLTKLWALRPAYLPKTVPVETMYAPMSYILETAL